jgi:hypothetical protein
MSMVCSTHGTINAFKILVRKHEGKRTIQTPRQRWEEDNIKMHLKEVVWEDVDLPGSE